MIRLTCLLLTLTACALPVSGPSDPPRTAAERSGGTRTSTYAEVLGFLEALPDLPHGDRLHFTTFGTSQEGRDLPLVLAAEPELVGAGPQAIRGAQDKLRILINANIHAGEVEGKEAVQMILREIALGEHGALIEDAVLLFVPIYNADGNERFDKRHRATQNGPEEGVGIRPNAQGLDLNRDFVKLEAPETRALLGLMRDYDPHLFLDLHTTNGSYHGYHLTYAPSLSTNIDPGLDRFQRDTFLPEVRRRMLARHDLRTFDYGNFTDEPDREWVTYDHRPRFGTNYVGLRNRLSVLSEAYSNVDFPTRIRATRAFVLEVAGYAVERRTWIRELIADAEQRSRNGAWAFGYDSSLGPATREVVLIGSVVDHTLPGDLGVRHVATDEARPVQMPVRRGFTSAQSLAPPEAWVLPEPTPRMQDLLAEHGLAFAVLKETIEGDVEVFRASAAQRADVEFQGHFELSLEGAWERRRERIPAGSLWIPADQRLARVAAQLLEPLSEDSASTWDKLVGWEKEDGEAASGSPVWRVPRGD